MDAIENKKAALQASSERHKEAISSDIKILANKADKTVSNTLLIAGVLLSTIAIYKIFKGKNGKKSPNKPNRFLKVLKQQIGLYLLNEGRAKIVDYINALDEKET